MYGLVSTIMRDHSLTAIAYVALLVWLVVDCVRNNNVGWIWLILIMQPIGAIAYILVHKLPEWNLLARLNRLFFGGYRIRELKAKIHHMNLPNHWVKLGDEYRLSKKWSLGAGAYTKAFEMEPANAEAKYGLGVCKFELGETAAAVELLYPLVESNPRFEHGTALLYIAKSYSRLGHRAEARQAFEWALQFYTYPEVQFEYAKLLYEMGDKEKAVELLKRLIEDGRNATGFKMNEDRRWGRKARMFLLRSQA